MKIRLWFKVLCEHLEMKTKLKIGFRAFVSDCGELPLFVLFSHAKDIFLKRHEVRRRQHFCPLLALKLLLLHG